MLTRPDRVARNEAAYRRTNERIERVSAGQPDLVGFVCECGRPACDDIVELTLAEYEHVRSNPRWFALKDGHWTELDRVVERAQRFLLVEKVGRAGDIAEETDPRS